MEVKIKRNDMYLKGQFIGKWCILKQSGDAYEVSNGKSVYRTTAENIGKGNFDAGVLMMHLPKRDNPVSKKVARPKKAVVKSKKK